MLIGHSPFKIIYENNMREVIILIDFIVSIQRSKYRESKGEGNIVQGV
jgi:hypothetical protein